ncbi:restriction endonuclease subunit S [Shewanella sp. SM87]|uniref:restriction endonuclease subunit S n=1 Tax=Shewanella sp. SM87 TaxID=2912808 RepID=UPI0021DA982B|nr:restriction endonuclease subunit S [Shewanella sp. SM87]MCU8009585.1 restriction endonuclease subunit S [Shewanella sp. SM87]
MSNLLPEGWRNETIGSFAKLQGGYAFKSSDSVQSGIRWLKIANVGKGKINWNDQNYLSSDFEEIYTNFMLEQGDTVIALTRPITQGELKVAQIRSSDVPSLLNQRVARVLPKQHLVDRHFMYSVFRYEAIARDIEITIFGTDPPNISTKQIEEIKVAFPPLPEQQKIAAILTSVDDVIEKTQAQIDKLKDLKSGMMQELLTKGVGIKQGDSANGKSYIPHSEFKDSPVGRIPKSWEVVKLGDTGKWRGGGTPSKTNKEFWSGSIPWVSPKDMKLDLISRTQDHVSAKAIKESSTNLIPKGSLLMVVRSGILQHTLPVAIAGCDLTVNQDIKALTVSERYDTRFIFHYLKAHNHKVLRATLKAGNTVESIDFNEFSKFVIPSPPFEEQVKIADLVDSVANKISSKVSKLNQTSNLKKALMQDLLTGKVRVKVDNDSVV